MARRQVHRPRGAGGVLPLQCERRAAVLGADEVGGGAAPPRGPGGRRAEGRDGLRGQPRPRLRAGPRVRDVGPEAGAERRLVVAGDADRAVAEVRDAHRVLLAAHDRALRQPGLGQVGRDEEQLARCRVVRALGDHRAAVGVPDHDRVAGRVQRRVQRGSVLDEAAGAGRRALAARRQRDRAAGDAGVPLHQLGDRVPPPRAVAHQRAVHEQDLHHGRPPPRRDRAPAPAP